MADGVNELLKLMSEVLALCENGLGRASGEEESHPRVIVGSVITGFVLLALLLVDGVYAFRQKGRAKRATNESNTFALWDAKNGSGAIPQLKGAKAFTLVEVNKYTNKFLETNNIGTGGYGMKEDGLQSDVNFDIWNEMNKSMDIEDESDSQYNISFTQTVCENERTHAVNGTSEFSTNMVFRSYEDLKHWVQKRGRSLGYIIVTKRSNQEKTKLSSFVSTVIFMVIYKNHNHEPALDMEGHPYAQRLSDNEIRLVVDLARKDVKPQEILLTLKQKNPNNVSTLRTIYNTLQKFRKSGHAETITGQMANGEASVSPSPPYTAHTFDANKMKQTVDHTNPFAVRNLVQGFDSAKHGSIKGQILMPCFKTFPSLQTDLMENHVKEVSDANLVRDMFMFDKKREGQLVIKQFLKGDYSLGQSSGGQTNTTLDSRDKEDKNID
nr:probable leucine-rich repeat receptor-like protein kinase At5g49770 [Tanacetum cinerariifolium]